MILAVLFDFDGTLTRPGALDFAAIRRAVGCPPAVPILEHIASLPDAASRGRAMAALNAQELEAARRCEPNDGAEETVRLLAARGLALGILTRNSRASVLAALARFPTLREGDFAVIVSREDPCPPKPHPDAVRFAAAGLGVATRDLLVVGDFAYDIEAGARAGARTVLLTNGTPPAAGGVTPDHVIASLRELAAMVSAGSA